MDELEISGKRYISTRRAAKDNKYSPDYIGQLIRGKKVVGQKVGRSWYVDEASLADYFGKEGNATAPVATKAVIVEEPREEEAIIEKIEVVTEAVAVKVEDEPLPVENKKINKIEFVEPQVTHVVPRKNPLHREVVEERSYRIPVSVKEKKGLVYLSDGEPLLPPIESKQKRSPVRATRAEHIVAPAPLVYAAPVYDEVLPVASHGSPILKGILIFSIGAVICAIVLGFSISISSHMIFQEGESVSTKFSL